MSVPQSRWAEWPIKIRELDVLRREYVTQRMVRVTLGGPGLPGFESHLADEHVKLVFPDPNTGTTRAPVQDGDHLDWPSPFPPTRDYTVRRYDPKDGEAGEVDFDFVVHEGGLASDWAQHAPIGSSIWVAGPRPSRIVPPEFGFHVLVGDETALPAIGRWLEELPGDARGVAVVEVADPAEEQPLRVPDGFSLTWLHRSDGSAPTLGDFVGGLTLPDDTATYVWAAGEAGELKPVRRWARSRGVGGKGQCDIGGYWRRGSTGGVSTTRRERLGHAVAHALGREH